MVGSADAASAARLCRAETLQMAGLDHGPIRNERRVRRTATSRHSCSRCRRLHPLMGSDEVPHPLARQPLPRRGRPASPAPYYHRRAEREHSPLAPSCLHRDNYDREAAEHDLTLRSPKCVLCAGAPLSAAARRKIGEPWYDPRGRCLGALCGGTDAKPGRFRGQQGLSELHWERPV
jgi:hypothetical protein